VTTILATFAIDYLLEAVFVGCAWAAATYRFELPAPTKRGASALLPVFAFLDLYWFPAIAAADLRFTIGNPRLAQLVGLGPNANATDLFTIGFFDLVLWGLQTVVALAVSCAIA
jgi:hypothetical protein